MTLENRPHTVGECVRLLLVAAAFRLIQRRIDRNPPPHRIAGAILLGLWLGVAYQTGRRVEAWMILQHARLADEELMAQVERATASISRDLAEHMRREHGR